jgi:Branched-chain amino acid transport protein (AzlD)
VTTFLVAGVFATYLWRFIGALAASRIDPESPVFDWVRAVATALVAALVARLVFAPSGLLAESALAARLGAFAMGLVVFALTRKSVPWGVAAAAATMLVTSLF